MDLERLRHKCHALQWSLDDVDWDAPGHERVSAEQGERLRGFMNDLYWIESIASVVFDAMARRATDPLEKEIFESFAKDERRHADAELALMARWELVERGQRLSPNRNARRLLDTLERAAHKVHPSVYSAIIPMTELVLDGALVKHLTRVVEDPVCHLTFDKINADEARHLAMDFHMLEKYGREQTTLQNMLDLVRSSIHPSSLYAMFFGYLPMLARGRGNVERIGLDQGDVRKCLARYLRLGKENPHIARHPTYRIMCINAREVMSGGRTLGDLLMRLSDAVDRASITEA
jgi:hypothetical protein